MSRRFTIRDRRFAFLLVGLTFGIGFLIGRFSAPRPTPIPRKVAKTVPSPRPAAHLLPTFPTGSGRIAIVLDDWGYSLNQLPGLLSIRQPVTVAVLPGLAFSGKVATEAHARGQEVILHLQMEAEDPSAPREKGTITTDMPRKEVLKKLEESLASVPFAKGISNHQGSKGTASHPLMQTLLGELKRRNLYFLDSLVTDRSVGRELAERLKVRFAQRAVFLDNDKSSEAIHERLVELARIASRNGQAIGIGHDRPVMVEILKEAAPALEKAGYTLVPASWLAEEAQ